VICRPPERTFIGGEPFGIRIAVKDDANTVADVLSEAFSADPIMRWTFGGPKAIRRAMQIFFLDVYLRDGLVFVDQQGRAAAMWLLPGRHGDLSLLARAQFAGAITPLEGFLPILRGLRYQAALARARELDPFLYLFAIGVRPDAQGLGAGSRLLSAGLEVARALGVPARLETSRVSNVTLYEKFGFRVRAEICAGESAPKVWLMGRDFA